MKNLVVSISLGRVRGGTCAVVGAVSGTTYSSDVPVNADGTCTVSVPNGVTEPLSISYTGGEYFSEATGQFIPLPAGRELRAVVPAPQDGSTVNVAVTSLTDLAARRIDSLPAGQRTEESILATAAEIAQFFAPGGLDILLPPGVIIDDSIGTSNVNDLYALVLASLDQFAADCLGNTPTSLFDVLDILFDDLADGILGDDANACYSDADNLDSLLDQALTTQNAQRGGSDVAGAVNDLINANRDSVAPTPTPTPLPTVTPTPAPTAVPTATPAPTATPTPSVSPTPTATPTPTPTPVIGGGGGGGGGATPTIGWEVASTSVNEGADGETTNVVLTLIRNTQPGDFLLRVFTVDGSAVSGRSGFLDDYVAFDQQILFPDTVESITVTVQVIGDDLLPDNAPGDEFFTVRVEAAGLPTPAFSPASTQVVILNDEPTGATGTGGGTGSGGTGE